jgi:Trk-type K+ transport system membrane component
MVCSINGMTPSKRVSRLHPPTSTFIRLQIGFLAGFDFLDAFLGLLPELDKEMTEQNLEADDVINGDTPSGL